jgi:hypothetical protein
LLGYGREAHRLGVVRLVPDGVLWGQSNDRHNASNNLLSDDNVRTVEDEGRKFLVVNMPRASRQQRPVFAA